MASWHASAEERAEYEMAEQFVHRVDHLRWRRHSPAFEVSMLCECWGVLDGVPDFAEMAANAGRPASCWCPVINPHLYERDAEVGTSIPTVPEPGHEGYVGEPPSNPWSG